MTLDFNVHGRGELIIDNVASVQHARWFEDEHLCLFVSRSAMLDATRHNDKFSWPHIRDMVAKLDPKSAAMNEKHFINILVAVPWEYSLDLHQLDFLSIEPAGNFRSPMLVDQREFLVEFNRLHDGLPSRRPYSSNFPLQ